MTAAWVRELPSTGDSGGAGNYGAMWVHTIRALVQEAQAIHMSCVISSNLLNFSEPLFPCLKKWGKSINDFIESL